MQRKTFYTPLLALLLVAGLAHAQSDNLPQAGLVPGNPLYIFDIISEGIGNFFTFNDVSKAERYLNQASERLAEARELAQNGKSDEALSTITKYEQRLDDAMNEEETAKAGGKDTEALLQKIADATAAQQTVLQGVLEKVPDQAKAAVQRALEKSHMGHDTAIEAISGEHPSMSDQHASSSMGHDEMEHGMGASNTPSGEDMPHGNSVPSNAGTSHNPMQGSAVGEHMDDNTSGSDGSMMDGTTVTLGSSGFSPSTITVKKGTTVTWNNTGNGPMWVATAAHPSHTVYDSTSRSEHCAAGYTGPAPFDQCGNGSSYSFTFNQTGTWKYHNHLKASETGTVIVE